MNHIPLKTGGETPLRPSPRKGQLWLNSAKGGDPMSHGQAQRSVNTVAEHYC